MHLLKAYINRIVCLKPLKIDNMTSKVPYYILLKQKGDQYACFESFFRLQNNVLLMEC